MKRIKLKKLENFKKLEATDFFCQIYYNSIMQLNNK